jgi:hypothetical protein
MKTAAEPLLEEDRSLPTQNAWSQEIPDEQWSFYKSVIDQMRARGLHFALGGAFSLATYTGRWRNTKDLDIYTLPQHREAVMQAVLDCGFSDYFDVLPYDRNWIFRAHCGDCIVDTIWAMANRRALVDEHWICGGPTVQMRDVALRIIPPEEMLWGKLYVLQRERSDWQDILNLLYVAGAKLDWRHLLRRVEGDLPLLRSAVSIYAWLCPGHASHLPDWLWNNLHLPRPDPGAADVDHRNASFIDTRPWFVVQPEGSEE